MQYAAFISYCHQPRDTACASWLVDALETYATPQALINQNIAANVGLIFRDQNELASNSDLTKEIKTALFAAEHLIVICSQHTPHSAWVRKEIALFKHWGREKNIHTVLIGDNPHKSFPPELYYWEIKGKGLDVSIEQKDPQGLSMTPLQTQTEAEAKTLVRDQLLARLLNCSLNTLRNRNAERLDKNTSYRYFNTFTYRWGVPEGIGEFKAETVNKRAESYKFHYREGRVIKVELINPFNYYAPDNDICQWDISYREDGKVAAIDQRNKHSDVKSRCLYSRDLSKIDFQDDADNASFQGAITSNVGLSDQRKKDFEGKKANISRHLLKYDDNGFLIEKRYAKNSSNQPAKDLLGIYGVAYVKNDLGLVTEEYFLDVNGKQISQPNGIASCEYTYDHAGNQTCVAFFDHKKTPCLGPNQRVHKGIDTYDAFGNWVSSAYFDTHGEACSNINGVHSIQIERNEYGIEVKQSYYDSAGKLCVSNQHMAIKTFEHDPRGNFIEMAYFDVDLNPCLGIDGVSSVKATYNAQNNESAQQYLGLDGDPCLCVGGYASLACAYDQYGNRSELSYADIDGKLIPEQNWGTEKRIFEHDNMGNVQAVRFLSAENQLMLNKLGFALVRYQYDEKNNDVEQRFYDTGLQLIALENGHAIMRTVYDDDSNVTEWRYYDENEQAVNTEIGALVKFTYDQHGNLKSKSYFDKNDNAFLLKGDYSSQVNDYDSRGNLLSVSYYIDGQPVINNELGYFKIEVNYNDRGQRIKRAFYDIQQQPINCVYEFHILTNHYDEFGRLIEEQCYDLNNKPCLNNKHYHCITLEYNILGKVTLAKLLDTEQLPINHIKGFHLAQRTYTDWGELIDTQFWDANGKLLEDAELDEKEQSHLWGP